MSNSQNSPKTGKIVIAGAGTIGCYVGGHLIHGDHEVCLLGRKHMADQILPKGLRLTNYEELDIQIIPHEVDIQTDPSCLHGAAIILVTVKSGATAAIAELIKTHAPHEAVIISLQNGAYNADTLRLTLKDHKVLSGMVPFNVVQMGDGHFHQGTSGSITIEHCPSNLANALSTTALPFIDHENIQGVLWGKLLINLNNALNALSGIPLREQFISQQWRALLADQMAEALPLLKLEGIQPVSFTPLPPFLAPHVLRLPNFLYRHFTSKLPKIDPKARSSMWEDLELGRKTEIDELQGRILQLAQKHGRTASLNKHIAELIHQTENAGKGSPCLKPRDLRI